VDVATQRDLSPGDITVSVVPNGFLLGRMLLPKGPGFWWEMVATVRSFRAALEGARAQARVHGSKAWFQRGPDEYQLIPTIGSLPSDTDSVSARE
jgi:hypothetical protein